MVSKPDLQSILRSFENAAYKGPHRLLEAREALKGITHLWDDGGKTRAEYFVSTCLQTRKGLFEYLYVTNSHVVDIVWSVLIDNYPESLGTFITKSCLGIAFSRLLDFYMSLPPNAEIPHDVVEAYRRAGPALKAVEAIDNYVRSATKMNEASNSCYVEDDDIAWEGIGQVRKRKSKQAERKQHAKAIKGHRQMAKKMSNEPQLDPLIFRSANYSPPEGVEEAQTLGLTIISDLKGVISVYLNGLVEIHELVNGVYEGQPDNISTTLNAAGGGDNGHTKGLSAKISVSENDPNVPTAFPHIQPLRAAALFEDTAMTGELGEWHVLISTKAFGQLRQLAFGNATVFDIVKKKIKELSHGFFSDDNQKHLVGKDQEVPIFEAKMTRDLRLVYQIECGARIRGEGLDIGITRYEQQQLRIFGIYTHAQLDKRLWASVAYQSVKRGREYRQRCLHREIPRIKTKGQNVTPPAIFPYSPSQGSDVNESPIDVPILEDVDYLELHAILALEKFIPYSHTLLDTVREDEAASHIFSVSQYEEEIIYHPSSCLVIGRSGTGKTTTMLFKMVALEKAARQSSTTIRQLFVTQSRVLAGRVEEYFKKLQASSLPSGHHTAALRGIATAKGQEKDLLELDDEAEDDSHLPAKWSDLEERHFPLFLTFDQLCKLLEGDCALSIHRESRTTEQRRASFRRTITAIDDTAIDLNSIEIDDRSTIAPASPLSTFSQKKSRKMGLLSFEAFLRDIWPHFDQGHSKGLDPALVFSEFMGVIRGSEAALSTANGYIDRSTYENMSERTQSTFAKTRSRIYSLFESYLKQKACLDFYDGPERTHALLRSLKESPLQKSLDFIYVDEVQDNLLLDAGLLHILCRSPHGMFWAGDTAQTIALGSSFRFDDLKAYLYRLETKDDLVQAGKRTAIHPAFFQLSTNYRSHGGIVDAATSVVALITKLFPHSIDTLAKEKGMVDGPKPVMFTGWGDDIRYEQFLFGEASSPIEFGAEQVILVRNEAAREHLRNQIGGDIGLILTLYESKGLEFSDVLLYNFFCDSAASAADWRVVLNALNETERGNTSVSRFDEVRHASIQTELKCLYVGLTRARKHVWIWDSSDRAVAMQTFWLRRSLITTCGPNDPIPQIAVESSAADWAKSGRLLFQKRLYIQSEFCFEKAGMEVEAAIAHAYQQRVEARKVSVTNKIHAVRWKSAADAFKNAAAMSTKPDEKRGLSLRAADCFVEISDHHQAAGSFADAFEYTKAAIHYRKAGSFDHALHIIQKHRSEVNQVVAERITSVVKLAYTKSHEFRKAQNLFAEFQDYIEFLEDLGLDDLRLQVLEDMQHFEEAATLAVLKGEIIKGVNLYLRSPGADSKGMAIKTLVDALWTKFSLGNPPPSDIETKELMELANSITKGHSEIEMFAAIQNKQVLTLTNLGRQFVDLGHQTQALLALDCALRNPPNLKVEVLDKVLRFLEGYQVYGQQIRLLIRLQDSVKRPGIQKLLNFKPVPSVLGDEPHEYVVALPSILRPYILDLVSSKRFETQDGLIVGQEDLRQVIQRCLSYRYNQSLHQLHNLAMNIQALQPCALFAVFGECNRPRCSQQHMAASDITIQTFSKRVRALIQIVMLLDGMIPQTSSGEIEGKKNLQRLWMERLFSALHPSVPALGSLPLLDTSAVPEFAAALPVLRSWIQDRMFTLFPIGKWFRSYMGGVVSTFLLAFTLDHSNARNYARRARCSRAGHGPLIRNATGRTVVEDCLIWLSSWDGGSLTAGVLFLRHIAYTTDLPIDVNALVAYTERLVVHLIFNYKLKSFGYTTTALGNITLPRSWIMYGLSQASPPDNPQRSNILVDAIAELLQSFWHLRDAAGNKRQSNFIYEDLDLSNVHYHLRSLVIARFCRAMVLLGYNIPHNFLKNSILRALSKCPDQKPHDLFAEFVQAQHWDQLSRAVRRTRLDSSVDELCQLVIGGENPNFRAAQGVRPIFFNSREELVRTLAFHKSAIPSPVIPTLDPTAKEFIPAALQAELNNVTSVVDDVAEEAPQEAEPVREALGVAPSQAETVAVDLFCRLYRIRAVIRKSPKLGNHFFDRCRAEISRVAGHQMEPKYIKYFLGPLPHLLMWLEIAIKRCVDGKKQQSAKLAQVTHDAYDRMMERINEISRLRKDLADFSRHLSPQSEFHRHATADKLRLFARAMVPLRERVDNVLGGPSKQEAEDYRLAYKGILQEAKPPQPIQPVRPSLNTADLEDF